MPPPPLSALPGPDARLGRLGRLGRHSRRLGRAALHWCWQLGPSCVVAHRAPALLWLTDGPAKYSSARRRGLLKVSLVELLAVRNLQAFVERKIQKKFKQKNKYLWSTMKFLLAASRLGCFRLSSALSTAACAADRASEAI